MNTLDPIHGAEVPGWPSVYVIGSYDSRITFFSQQVRAFHLAHALVEAGMLKANSRIAVIGAGAAGLSVAAGLSLLRQDIRIDVFEREQHPLHLQRGCTRRNLHPHIYEWPRQGADVEEAGLPYLDWKAGTADMVAAAVVRQFGMLQIHRDQRLVLKNSCEVTALTKLGSKAYLLTHRDSAGTSGSGAYDAVFLTIGFGAERPLADLPIHSYWSDRGAPDAPRYAADTTKVIVTGNGDGGLIDLCAAALGDFNHTALITELTAWPGMGELTEELLGIDRAAEREGKEFDFVAAYDLGVGPKLRAYGLVSEIAGRLRPRMGITFNTERDRMLEQPTSTLNRLLVYLLLAAAKEAGTPIEHLAGPISVDPARRGIYRIAGKELEADELFVRHGAAKREAFAPFESIRSAYEADHQRWLQLDPQRGAPPRLSTACHHALEQAMISSQIPVPRGQLDAAIARQPVRARVGRDPATATVVWSGSIVPLDLLQWWGDADRALTLECAGTPQEIGVMAGAVARFIVHARQLRVETDGTAWGDWLSELTLRSQHAGAMQRAVTVNVVAAYTPCGAIDAAGVARDLHARMDRLTLDQANEHLEGYLVHGNEPANWITWPIEPDLRSAMARRWKDWLARVSADSDLLARLLRMTACTLEDDDGDLADRQVLVGPLRLPNITRTLALALAAAEAWPTATPRARAPGNFEHREDGAEIATIHACGADLIGRRDITRAASTHNWQTAYVLLSELTAPVIFEEAGERSLAEVAGDVPRLDAPPPSAHVIVGADAQFLDALEAGTDALVAHLEVMRTAVGRRFQDQIDKKEIVA